VILVKPSFEIMELDDGMEILRRIERIARVCYKSEDRITEVSCVPFCEMLVKRGHYAMLEHGGSISVRFIANRGFSHELVRHRIASYAQESTRFCDYRGGVTFVIPPWVSGVESGTHEWKALPMGRTGVYKNAIEPEPETEDGASVRWLAAMLECEANYKLLLEEGWTPQQARGVLPIDLKTEIVITTNPTEWRHVFKMRDSKKAHPQMQQIMEPLHEEMKRRIPVLFELFD